MVIAAAATVLSLNGQVGIAALGYAVAVILAVANKVRMVRRGRDGGSLPVATKPWRLLSCMAVGGLIGLVFFPILAAFVISGMGRDQASIVTACVAGLLFAVVFVGVTIMRRWRKTDRA